MYWSRSQHCLVCLKSKFEQVQIQILGRERGPHLKEVISQIREEESWRNLISFLSYIENTAFVVRGENSDKGKL